MSSDQLLKLVEEQESTFKTGNVDTFKKFYDENRESIQENYALFNSLCLHVAAKVANLDLIKHLISLKADINYRILPKGYKERDAVTPIEACLVSRSRVPPQQLEDCLQLLIQNGADSASKNNALLYAARQGRLSVLKLLLDTKIEGCEVNVNYADPLHLNSALLLIAFHTNSLECLEYLIEKGADINQKNAQGNTSLHQLVAPPGRDITVTFQLLLNKGGDFKAKNNHEDTPLTKSIRQGNLGAVLILMEKLSAEDVNQQDSKGISPVHEAAIWGQYEILEKLLEKGGNVNIQDLGGNSPLHLACDKSIIGANSPLVMKVQHVNLLLEKGAKIELVNFQGETPLHNMNVPIEKIDILLQHNANKEALDNKGETPLIKAIRLGAIQHVDKLIKSGADMTLLKDKLHTLIDEKGNTILHRALLMEYEYFDTFLKLLNFSNFSINTKNRNGNTLLHIIAEQDLHGFLEPILSKGADSSVTNEDGLSPLDISIKNESVQIIVELVKTPADVEKIKKFVNLEGNTLLHRAVSVGSEDAVKALIKFGLDVNATPKDVDSYSDSGTPLHLAAQKDLPAIAVILLDSGADINNQGNYDNNAPLHVAARFGNSKMVDLLLKRNADAKLTNKDNEVALQMAEYSESGDCIKLLSNKD